MLLRGHISRDQLQLILEMEKIGRKNRSKKKKEKQWEVREQYSTTSTLTLKGFKKKVTW